MTTEEFYAHALLAAFRSQETNNLRSVPEQNEIVSLANNLTVLLTETYDKKPKTVLIIIATTLYWESGKFFKSEKAGYDIGFERALLDWTTKYRSAWNEKRHRQSMKPGWFVIDPDIARGPAVASLARKRPLWASTDQHFSI
jgi:hypothetical protein